MFILACVRVQLYRRRNYEFFSEQILHFQEHKKIARANSVVRAECWCMLSNCLCRCEKSCAARPAGCQPVNGGQCCHAVRDVPIHCAQLCRAKVGRVRRKTEQEEREDRMRQSDLPNGNHALSLTAKFAVWVLNTAFVVCSALSLLSVCKLKEK